MCSILERICSVFVFLETGVIESKNRKFGSLSQDKLVVDK